RSPPPVPYGRPVRWSRAWSPWSTGTPAPGRPSRPKASTTGGCSDWPTWNCRRADVDPTEADAPGPTEWTAGEPVGVGPWPGDWPDDPRYDPDLLREGDRRNVVDAYRYWRRPAIVADIDARRHPFHVAIENFGHDHNIGTVVRTANAFAAAAVHIVGRARWNRRGAMVTDRYQHLHHHATLSDLLTWADGQGLVVVAVDNHPGS